MPLSNSEKTYGSVSKWLHWLMAVMLVGAMVGGNLDAAMPKGEEKVQALLLHKSFGVLILGLLLMRLSWRVLTPQPQQVSMPAWQQKAARWGHWALYLLMAAQPLSGLMMSQFAGKPVNFFGIFELPMLVSPDKSMAKFFHEAHEVVWLVLAAAALGHVVFALRHHFIDRDDTLRRMGWGRLKAD